MILTTLLFLIFGNRLSLSSSVGMGGMNLKLTGYHSPPYDILYRHPDGNYSSVGSTGAIFDWLSQRLNFTIILIPVVDKAEIKRIGIIEAATNKILNKEVDGFLGVSVITPEKAQVLDYTCGIIWSEPYNLVVPKPEYESRLFAFVRPFQLPVWLTLGVCIVIFVGVMSSFSSWYNRATIYQITQRGTTNLPFPMIDLISYYAVYVMNILTNHGAYTPYYYYSFRILVGCWLLGALVLVNSYSSIVVSSLTVPKLQPAVNSFQDLVSNGEVTLISQKSVVITQIILSAQSGVYLALGNQLRQHPERMFLDFPSTYKKLGDGHHAFAWISSNNFYYVVGQFRKDGQCRFQLSDPLSITQFTSAVVLQKGFKYTSLMSNALIELWETGLTQFWVRNITEAIGVTRADKCLVKNPPKSTTAIPIKLMDLTSAFLLLGIGVGVSILVFLVELAVFKLSRRKTQKCRLQSTMKHEP